MDIVYRASLTHYDTIVIARLITFLSCLFVCLSVSPSGNRNLNSAHQGGLYASSVLLLHQMFLLYTPARAHTHVWKKSYAVCFEIDRSLLTLWRVSILSKEDIDSHSVARIAILQRVWIARLFYMFVY